MCVYEKTKINKKEAGIGPFLKTCSKCENQSYCSVGKRRAWTNSSFLSKTEDFPKSKPSSFLFAYKVVALAATKIDFQLQKTLLQKAEFFAEFSASQKKAENRFQSPTLKCRYGVPFVQAPLPITC